MNDDNVTYFDSFRVEYIQKEIIKFIDNKISQQVFIKYKKMIEYVDNFVLDLLIL